ncbi:consortin-like isoform X2 [Cottoperca gobio]|uniref:Consortin-like isoform X2 n=1 Tax=Cottoperca gobio TaxID=56716 RepID=A0A6J2S497_COTGO|nr:consortin-like isoform X2 [Cottoperca gobio]
MDHGGQLEREDRVMSKVQVGGVDLCDNLSKPEDLTAQTQNLNETSTLAQKQSLCPSRSEEGGEIIQKASVNNNGKDMEEEQGQAGYTGRGREDEEEDIDEVMKDEEEEEESSCLIRCQSPDTPMTDSSYSDTGSLLETLYPFSPGTSPEPTSPLLPVSQETAYPTSQVELSQSDVKVDSHNTESVASTIGPITQAPTFTTGPKGSTTPTLTSDTCSPGITEDADRIAKNFPTEYLTSETFPLTACTTRLNTSIASTPLNAKIGPLTFTTGPTTAVSTCATGPIPNPALLESLEDLAQRGDDTHLPQYLHQIAETFVLNEDYQRALWCIQLERLYHQRVLDNLNALQEQWESQCRSSSSDLATQHLDTLKNICQTHSRPGARDAACASLDPLRPTFDSCTSAHQVDEGIEQAAKDSSPSQSSHPVIPSINLTDGLNPPEISESEREDLGREV